MLIYSSKNVFAVLWNLSKCKVMLYLKITIIILFSPATDCSSGGPLGPNVTDAEASFIIYSLLDKKMLCECN